MSADMEDVERTVAVRNCSYEHTRGPIRADTLNQAVGGDHVACVEHSHPERAVTTVKYNGAIEWLGGVP